MNYRVVVEFSDEDGQEPMTSEEITTALYFGKFPSLLPGRLIDIKDVEVDRY